MAAKHNYRNKSSFFSRFAPKKKDVPIDINDDASEAGDRRTEGMDADVFSQPIGYIPQFPPPPKYIKVRSHGKKEKDFNRIFLAQELRGRTGVEIAQTGGRLVKNGMPRPGDNNKDGNAIWAMEFSKDGKYLAAGGKDYAVRVWAVLATKEDRHAHELEEDAASKEGERIRLHAPVFQRKTVREYSGHTASVLDLSWSKVICFRYNGEALLTIPRTIFSYHLQWTRLCASGMLPGKNACVASSIAISLHLFNSTPGTTASSSLVHSTPSFACGAYQTKALPTLSHCQISLQLSRSLRTAKSLLPDVSMDYVPSTRRRV